MLKENVANLDMVWKLWALEHWFNHDCALVEHKVKPQTSGSQSPPSIFKHFPFLTMWCVSLDLVMFKLSIKSLIHFFMLHVHKFLIASFYAIVHWLCVIFSPSSLELCCACIWFQTYPPPRKNKRQTYLHSMPLPRLFECIQ